MRNEDVVRMLNETADMLELEGESVFRVRAYREAARRIENAHEDVNRLVEEKRLTDIRGIGPSIAEKISEFVNTGRSTYHDRLEHGLPTGIAQLLRIPGVGAKKAQLIHDELGVSTIEEIEQAAREHRLCKLPKMKEKTERNILQGIERLKQRSVRAPLGVALPEAEYVVGLLREEPPVERVEAAGSIRRMKETIHDIDILVSSEEPERAVEAFISLPVVAAVLARGTTKASVLTKQEMQMDLRVVAPDEWGSALQYFTGSKDHSIRLRTVAESLGLKLNEYGVFRVDTDEKVAGATEEEVYEALGLRWMAPELREAAGEIEAAQEGRLPDLVDVGDLRGDLHTHTDWSDGRATIEQMADAARERGYEYLAISDHSVSMGFVHGLSVERIEEQRAIIDKLNKRSRGFRLLHGIEVNIRSDGALDYPDDVLERFDVVTASIHGGLSQPREKITQRMIAAVRNPHVDIIGHPSGRLINKREPSDFDLDAVIAAAAETGTALEINSQPDRLDLKDSDARRAMEGGALIAISSDSHSTDQLGLVRYGVGTARRGWVTKDLVINAMPLEKLMSNLRR